MRQKMKNIPVTFAILSMLAAGAAYPVLAEQSAQPTFPSANEATQALFQAVQNNDEPAIANILGGPTELTTSRDPGQDKLDRELFVKKYQEMHRLTHEPDGSLMLCIGAENWPFPVPLIQKEGAWRFDADAGQKEVLFRQVGENELTAMAICHEFAASGKPGRAKADSDQSAASLPASVTSGSTGGGAALFQGYYFRVLATPRGTALIAYPAEYRSSGVMTFIATKKDAVYEKDLGPNTSSVASAMSAFHKDSTWRAARE
jgi:hypothetical protein